VQKRHHLRAARDVIRGGVIPDSGHLIHMASHIDVQLGEYETTIDCNLRAVQADLRLKARAGAAAHRAGVSTSGDGPAMYDVYCAPSLACAHSSPRSTN